MTDSTEDRRQRHYELLKKSRDALSAEQEDEVEEAAPEAPAENRRERDRRGGDRRAADNGTYMYRGREVKRGLGAAPGSGGVAGSTSRTANERSDEELNQTIKAALAKLSQLHAEGKISDEDYEQKKQKLLSRL